MRLLILFLLPLYISAQNCDILIKNGKIIDGTGNSWYYADMAVKNGKILAIGPSLNYKATRVIDAKGLIVAPGFIDVHTHLEGDEVHDPMATIKPFASMTRVAL